MKKTFKMQNLDCAHCAAKMEESIKKIPGVNDATVSFMTQKLSLDYDETKEAEILEAVAKACQKVDGACRIV